MILEITEIAQVFWRHPDVFWQTDIRMCNRYCQRPIKSCSVIGNWVPCLTPWTGMPSHSGYVQRASVRYQRISSTLLDLIQGTIVRWASRPSTVPSLSSRD